MATTKPTPASILLSHSAKDSPTYDFPFAPFLLHEHAHPAPATPYKPSSSLVCKHWLRGLCKKGAHCEFLHEYNLRAMPACGTYARYGACPNGTDCLFLHAETPEPLCAHYERGFCPLGPACASRHEKSTKGLCRFYLAGFCPEGRDCNYGAHPLWKEKDELEKLVVRKVVSEEEKKRIKEEAAERVEKDRAALEEREFGRDDGANKGRGRGRGGRWQGRRRERN